MLIRDQRDVVLLSPGEKAYAEWYGDTKNPDLCGDCGLSGNREAIDKVRALGKPTVCCIVAGRNVFIDQYAKEHGIPTGFTDTNDYQILKIIALTVLVLAILVAANVIFKKIKKSRSSLLQNE